MKLSLKNTNPQNEQQSTLLLGIFEDGTLTSTANLIDKKSKGQLSKLLKQGAFNGKIGQTLHLYSFANSFFNHLMLVGCGKQKSIAPTVFRKIIQIAVKALIPTKAQRVVCYLSDLAVTDRSTPWKVKQIAEGSWDALYRFDFFKSEKEPKVSINDIIINVPQASQLRACEKALKQGQAVADGVTFTKNLANLPSNICTPSFLAESAKDLGKAYKALSVKILGEAEMKKLGMGAILAVAQGSAEEAKLICLEYRGTSQKRAPIALVGKGITFDTGGNSLKSPENMVGMKYDMCGAATVLGTIKAAAELKLPINIVGVIAAVENMPGGTAYKPEDILTSLSGQTIEVISTDAEGRVILCDALTYCERYKPEVVIDIATLTGAVVIALGVHTSGLLSNDEKLAHALLQAGLESNDRAWQLPLYDEYQEQIKSSFADMANSGGRTAGTITAACFLSRFTKKFRWAHLDVAGTAAMMMGGAERYATGRPVPLLMQYLIDRAK